MLWVPELRSSVDPKSCPEALTKPFHKKIPVCWAQSTLHEPFPIQEECKQYPTQSGQWSSKSGSKNKSCYLENKHKLSHFLRFIPLVFAQQPTVALRISKGATLFLVRTCCPSIYLVPLKLDGIVCLQKALLNWRQGLEGQFCLISLQFFKKLVFQLIGNWSHCSSKKETMKFREPLQGLGSFQAIGNFHRQRDTALVQVQIKLS